MLLLVQIDHYFGILLRLALNFFVLKLVLRLYFRLERVDLIPLRYLSPVLFVFLFLLHFFNLYVMNWLLMMDFGFSWGILYKFSRTEDLLLLIAD